MNRLVSQGDFVADGFLLVLVCDDGVLGHF